MYLNGDDCNNVTCDVCHGRREVTTEAAAAFDPASWYGESPEQTATRLAARKGP